MARPTPITKAPQRELLYSFFVEFVFFVRVREGAAGKGMGSRRTRFCRLQSWDERNEKSIMLAVNFTA